MTEMNGIPISVTLAYSLIHKLVGQAGDGQPASAHAQAGRQRTATEAAFSALELRHRTNISSTILTAVAGALRRCRTLAVLVPRRARRLALPPATTAIIAELIFARRLIHERMILEAKRNLVYTSMSVSIVSYMIGFSDPAYFTRFFKRQVCLSPKDFRRQAGT